MQSLASGPPLPGKGASAVHHVNIAVPFLALSLLAGPTGALAQQVSPAAGSAQVPGTPAAAAQLPRLVKFSGAAKDAIGKPMSNLTGITFALYQDQQGGTALWTENQNVQPDAAGHYTVWLGATTNEGMPVDLFASGQARWLGVQVEGQPEQARVLLAAVPYALKAGDADTLGGRPASAYLLAGSPAAVQPSEAAQPAQPATPVTARTAAAAVVPSFSSGGSTNYIAKFTDTSGDVGNSVMYQNGSSIGINTTASLDILDVAGSITAEVDGGPSSGPALDLRNTPSTGFGIGSVNFYTYPGQTVPSAQWQAKDIGGFTASQTLYTAGSLNQRNQPLIPRLTVMGGTGNVGIGTTTPVAPLEVNGDAQVDGNLTMKGLITFGSGQTFPGSGGSGTVTSVSAGTGLTASPNPITTSGTLSIASNACASGSALSALPFTCSPFATLGANTFAGNQTVNGNLNATGFGIGGNLIAFGNYNYANAFLGYSGNATMDDGAGYNTGSGYRALFSNTTGGGNTASGVFALTSNTTGGYNTASGDEALLSNTTGNFNTAYGTAALLSNTTGNENTAIGASALYSNTTGSNNIAVGYNAGLNVTGSNNIHIGNEGVAGESNTISIGTPGTQTSAYMAGIWGAISAGGSPVYISPAGQLGILLSSRRYKEDIRDMAEASSGLLRLRPVTFRYKKPFSDGSQPVQYGLIAEEVAEVYPDLVAHSADGQVETVKYQLLEPMLLNELQKQNATIATLKEQIRDQEQQIRVQEQRIAAHEQQNRSLEERLAKVEAALGGTTVTTASR
jgi:trimeric autotransporter adhesin